MFESRASLPTDYKDRTHLSPTPTVRIIPFSQRLQNKPKLLDLLRETVRNAVIVKYFGFHTLRHSFATHLLEEGYYILPLEKEVVCSWGTREQL